MATEEVAQWVRAARSGDTEAVGRLYLVLRRDLLPRLKKQLPPQLDPEDILTDTLVVVWLGLKRLRDPERFLAYAWHTARHLAGKAWRDHLRFVPIVSSLDLARPDPAASNSETEERLIALLDAMSVSDRELFQLLYVSGATSHEVESALGVSHSNALVIKHRLRLRIQHLLTHLRWELP